MFYTKILRIRVSAIFVMCAALVSFSSTAFGASVTDTFDYTGTTQYFVVPSGVTSINAKMWGAGGGGGSPSRTELANGGGAGFASGLIAVSPGETLAIEVGGGGSVGISPV